MRIDAPVLPAVLATLLIPAGLAGCSKHDCLEGDLVVTDDHNFTYSGDMLVESWETAAAQSIEVCWDAADQDLQCHDIDPVGDIDNVGLIRFEISPEEVEEGLANNSISQSDNSGYVEDQPGDETCVHLADFSFFGTEIDIKKEYVEGNSTFMLVNTSGTVPGVGARLVNFLEPKASSTVTRVDLPSGCGTLDFSAALKEPVDVCDDTNLFVDWSGVNSDGLGNPFTPTSPDLLTVGYYEGLTADELESQFLDIEIIATTQWNLQLTGNQEADLTQALDDDGKAFSGFDPGGIYIIALRDTTSPNPAPLFLTVLNPPEK